MNNPFNNPYLRDWLLNCFELYDIGIKHVITTGAGPFDENEFDDFLNHFKITSCIPSEDIEILIVGMEEWDESIIKDTLNLKENSTLKVYSQEMFLTFMLTGIDPYDSEYNILEEFTKEHPVFQYLFSYGFDWPSTFVNINENNTSLIPDWPSKGFLGWLDYRVGRSGHKISKRHKILEQALYDKLPSALPKSYSEGWGDPGSAERLMKIANSIASFCRNAKRRQNSNTEIAIQDWESDLEWLKDQYYLPSNLDFKWPNTNF
jgi:hypothetical protein